MNSGVSFITYMLRDHPEELKDFINNYKTNKTLTVEYQSLKRYDADLAELIKNRPEEMFYVMSNKIIGETSKIPDNSKIYFNIIHYDNKVELKDISSEYIGQLIQFKAYLKRVYDVHPKLEKTLFECRGCMRLQEIEQVSVSEITEPSLCPECGGRSFRLLQDDSTFIDSQRIDIYSNDTNHELPLMLYGDLCSWDNYKINDCVSVLGIVKTFKPSKNKPFEKYIEVININIINDNSIENISFDDLEDMRNTPEYNNWVKKVISDSNNVCQCCGGNKHLHAHHIFSYKDYPDLRLDPENGIALCKWCHGKYNSYYGHKGTGKNLMKFIKKFGVK